MAIIYGYPTGTPTTNDNVLGTQVDPVTEENKTVQFNIGQMNTLAANNYLESTVTVTNAQWLALSSLELVPNQGAGKYIKVLSASIFFDYVSTNLTFAQALVIRNNGGNAQVTIPTSLSPVTGDVVYSGNVAAAQLGTGSLIISTTGATAGNGSVQIKFRYQVLDTSAF
tara:strand:- start:308 stop:814 length:507 start_codon:yes stop_codon:yes gene_type:complete